MAEHDADVWPLVILHCPKHGRTLRWDKLRCAHCYIEAYALRYFIGDRWDGEHGV